MEKTLKHDAPLPDRMRPSSLEEFVGQEEVIGQGSMLRLLLAKDEVPSMIFWGPPGTGKTTLARLIALMTKARFVQFSAVSSGVADLRAVVHESQERLKMHSERTILFVDEIHRWNKAQQDAFLPFVENGTVILIGATTENPSFEVNAALLSRCKVFVLERLAVESIEKLLERALVDTERGLGGRGVEVGEGVLKFIAEVADGDARAALNLLEMTVKSTPERVSKDSGQGHKLVKLTKGAVAKLVRRSHLKYDQSGEEHYNIISALHKSLRGSDPDAALYWLGRMLEAGEKPEYIARRLVRFASEDIGLADPNALVQALAAFDAAHKLGVPECDVCLAQAVVYLARASKSNELYLAYGQVKQDVELTQNEPVPIHLRNTSTKLMKDLGYGRDYIYNPSVAGSVEQDYFPEKLRGKKYLKNLIFNVKDCQSDDNGDNNDGDKSK
ncbi:replication-associated recombination protein A [Patescibacteria group bacterium]|nr:replication-associated recombination protein A [Patescibacteria group bacterium]